MNAIHTLLHPRSIAVIGASADASKTAGRPVAYLQKHGYGGAIYPVNPRADQVAGLTCYPDIDSLPGVPDVGLVLVAPDRAIEAVGALSRRGTPAAIVLASGFGETGESGARRQQALKEAAGGMRLLGPNTIGLVNLTDRIMLCASGALEMESLQGGGIAVVSQSGGILGSLLSRAAAAGLGFSKLVSTGNEVDLEAADFIDHLADDPATQVIALYMEGLRNPEKFRQAALKAARAGKPVVVYKVGRSESGARSAASHTGALAGEDRVYDALFSQVGAVRAQTFADLLDIPAALATRRPLRGKRIAILTSTGGAGTLVADSLGVAGFETPPPGPETAARLRDLQKNDQIVLDRNPIDVTLAGLQPELLRSTIATLLDSADYDAVITIVGSSALAQPTLAAGAIAASLDQSDKPVLAYVSPHAPAVLSNVNRAGAPAFTAPESFAAVLSAMLARTARENAGSVAGDAGGAKAAGAGAAGAAGAHAGASGSSAGTSAVDAADLPSGSLNEAQARALFARYGIPSVGERAVADAAQGQREARAFDRPVVLKVLSSRITHKTEAGGVAVGVAPEAVGEAIQAMAARVRERTGIEPEGYLLQEMASGVEMIVGVHRDPQLGPTLLVGLGGVTAELFQDTALRLLPVDRATVGEMLRSLKSWPLLDGYRGRPKADVKALEDAVLNFAAMAGQLGDRLVEAEINPLFVQEEGRGVRAADGVAILK
ncbi:6-carboxyhexanoate--CoA ligase [Bordetella genomosp. 9]|uniref:6-carboxyhexanoate--CoA ligase n=1 Tax=Bordetella genomosp. 9 TaxID=1416803 RepID=A0A261R593_9BORD|nr:acetate--CoA ligase family protein [Bordetella genomosp. 9]OZI20188.1 6-carboxyhexanoate--CoA ligase [Bordetella genomosp. 9]